MYNPFANMATEGHLIYHSLASPANDAQQPMAKLTVVGLCNAGWQHPRFYSHSIFNGKREGSPMASDSVGFRNCRNHPHMLSQMSKNYPSRWKTLRRGRTAAPILDRPLLVHSVLQSCRRALELSDL